MNSSVHMSSVVLYVQCSFSLVYFFLRGQGYNLPARDGVNCIYRTIRSLINTQSCQLRENLALRRMSLVGLIHIPTLVSALNSTIVFLFQRRFQ
jgi:hypothetical protein